MLGLILKLKRGLCGVLKLKNKSVGDISVLIKGELDKKGLSSKLLLDYYSFESSLQNIYVSKGLVPYTLSINPLVRKDSFNYFMGMLNNTLDISRLSGSTTVYTQFDYYASLVGDKK